MIVLSASNLKKSYPTQDIFDNVSFKIEKGEKVGLIGANGSGKTTLFNILTNEISKDGGDIFKPTNVSVGYLKQQLSIDSEKTIYEHCVEVFSGVLALEKKLRELEKKMADPSLLEDLDSIMKEYTITNDKFEKNSGYSYKSEINGALKGLGFEEDDFDKKVNTLSGGQKARVELAILILKKPDLILLDEPTNHLDIKAINFLENFIKNFQGSVMVISHDRYFLDNTVNRIFLMENKTLRTYDTNYTNFMIQRKKDIENYIHRYNSQKKEIERQEEIIQRLKNLGGSKRKRGISQSRSRQKLLDKMEKMDAPPTEKKQMNLRFTPRITSGMDVIKAEDISKSFDNDKIFENISFEIFRTDRVGLIGENGVGKTTIFKIIMNQLSKDSGTLRIGSSVNIGYFDQEQKNLNPDNTVIEEIWDDYPNLTNFEIRSYLAKFMFYKKDVLREINELSGGERARLSLLKMMLSNANFILMDEPTNHLDIDSKEVLEDAILNYEGTVFVISHDRYFLNKVANKIFVMNSNRMDQYLGNYDYYLNKLKELNDKEEVTSKKTKTEIKKENKKNKEYQKSIRKIKNEIKDIEKEIDYKQEELDKLNKLTYDTSIYEDDEKSTEIFKKISRLKEELEQLEEKWLKYSERFEQSV